MKEKVLIIVFILILGSILTGILIGVDNYTKPIIDKNIEVKTKSSIMEAFKITYSPDNLDELFSSNIKIYEEEERQFYMSSKGEVAFRINGSGFQGPIQGIIALKPDLRTIKAIKIVSQVETPGLGGRIAEEEFLARFENKKVFPDIKILSPGKAANDNEVDGIAGATMSIRAFEKLVNEDVKEYVAFIKEKK